MRNVVGRQTPRIYLRPDYVSSAGQEAIEVAEVAGLFLDPWQKLVLTDALGETPAGRWAAYRIGLEVARQNGKGGVLEARELAGLFAFGEKLIIHSAHEQSTSSEHFRRILNLMEGVPEFDRRILKVVRGKGAEAIELRDGYRIFFKTRTGGSARGFTGDLVVLDEAMMLAAAFMAALVPTMAARSIEGDPQLWLVGSAVDKQKHEHGIEFARVREDALKGIARLAYFGWNAPFDTPDDVPAAALVDPEMWAMGNPGLGIRISAGYVEDEQRALGPREFAVERLGVGDWPATDGTASQIIPDEVWNGLRGAAEQEARPRALAFDVNPERSFAAVAAADGNRFVKVLDHRPGTGWVVERLKDLADRFGVKVWVDEKGPGASLIDDLKDEGVLLEKVNGSEYARACGSFYDSADQATLGHEGSSELDAAVKGATKRKLGDAYAWDRQSSAVDISPLVAVTLALHGADRDLESVYEERGVLAISLD